MPTFGSTPTFNWYEWNGVNTENEIAHDLATMPAEGDITSISCYFGGDGATVQAKLCIWDAATGLLLAATPAFTASAGSRAVGGQAWQTQDLSSPLHLPAGKQIYIGWWRAPSGSAVFSTNNTSGNNKHKTDTSGSPGSLSGALNDTGVIGAYATYTAAPPPSGSRVWVTATAIKISYPA